MKNTYLALLAVAGALTASCASTSSQAAPMDEQAMMAKWMEYSMPGEAHKMLEHKVGYWKLKVRMFNPDGSSAGESDATSECAWVMDGRFVEEKTTGTFSGMPFLGRGMSGFDNIKQRYIGSWVDNMGTGMMTFEGSYDPATKTITYKGQGPDPMAWEYVPTRSMETMIDEDHAVMKSYAKGPEGKDYLQMQIDYTRTTR
ncbi:MAG: DUF1579 domain-containing protein [Planctomycetes bacterium]|nr:DUF1579 domain-containing protein [Planctomycetota bacterium]